MGGSCSRKRDQVVNEDCMHRGMSGRSCKSGSSKWLGTSFARHLKDVEPRRQKCPPLMDMCISRICLDIDKYTTFSMIPRDISQQIFNELVYSERLTDASLQAFRDCALQDIYLGHYPGVSDSWMDVISSQGASLLSVDLSASNVTDSGLSNLKDCMNLQTLSFNFCDHITDYGLTKIKETLEFCKMSISTGVKRFTTLLALEYNGLNQNGLSNLLHFLINARVADGRRVSDHGSNGNNLSVFTGVRLRTTDPPLTPLRREPLWRHWGLTSLTSLSLRRNSAITALGMSSFASLVNLVKLDLERCPGIHGGFVHLKGLTKLESLNIKWCNCIIDSDMEPLSGLTNLKALQIPCSRVTDDGITYLKGLHKLVSLNLEGCLITAASLDTLSALGALLYLNLSRCNLSGPGCEKFSGLGSLKMLNLGFSNITDTSLVYLKGLLNLVSLNLDSCTITDEGLFHLSGLYQLKCLELSDTEVGSSGLQHLSGLTNLETINLSFTSACDIGMKQLSGLSSLKSLNLDASQITDAGLAALTSLTALTSLDLFGAYITDLGMSYIKNFKNLRSLETCGGGITDVGVRSIKDLSSLTFLNLSQNCSLTDKSLELISGLTALVSLNLSNSQVTSAGLKHLKPLKNLFSLSLKSCKVTANDIRRFQSTDLPNLVVFHPN